MSRSTEWVGNGLDVEGTGLRFRVTPVRVLLLGMVLMAAVLGYLRFSRGLGATTNLTDAWPWGLWIAFDVLCGVALAAGAFVMAAAVHVFQLEDFRPFVRPAIVTGFLGYLLVILGLLFDLGRPYNIWHPIVMWQPHSVMFEVAWCVMLYTTVLALEFSPMLFERMNRPHLVHRVHRLTPALVILGAVLSTLHQSSLGSLFLITKGRMDPLWYSKLLPVFFFVSAIGAGLGMVVLESLLSGMARNQRPETPLLARMTKAVPWVMGLYLALKLGELAVSGELALLARKTLQAEVFMLELLLGAVLPAVLFLIPSVRKSTEGLFAGSVLLVGGVVFNRLNVAIFSMQQAVGRPYFPSWQEVGISAGLVALGVLLYLLIVENLPVFEGEKAEARPAAAFAAGGGSLNGHVNTPAVDGSVPAAVRTQVMRTVIRDDTDR